MRLSWLFCASLLCIAVHASLTIDANVLITGTLDTSAVSACCFPIVLAQGNHVQSLAVWPSFTMFMIDQAVHGNWSTTHYNYVAPASGYYRCTINGGIYYTASTANQYYGIGIMVNGVLTGFYAPVTFSAPTEANYAFQDVVYAAAGATLSFAGTAQIAGYETYADGGLSTTYKISVQQVA